jgi:hypothetical protein
MPVSISGTDGITSPTITTTGVIVSGTTVADATAVIRPLVSATSVASTSGTSIDFTSIPSWAKRITVMLNGVSTNGTSNYQIQLGDSGGIETTGYNSGAWTQNINSTGLITSGLVLTALNAASVLYYGNIIISNFGSNTWVSSHSLGGPTGNYQCIGGGSKALSDTLTQLRITTVNGTDTFDAGTINILYE